MPDDRRTSDGAEFERQVASLFGLRPDCRVRYTQLIAGKAADLIVDQDDPIGGTRTIVVECKAHSKPLSRTLVASIVADYSPALLGGKADLLLLVTQRGIVPNAAEALSAINARHITERQLLESLLSTELLLRNAESAFQFEGLSAYYQPATAVDIAVGFAAANFDAYYGPLADAAVAGRFRTPPLSADWRQHIYAAAERRGLDPTTADEVRVVEQAVTDREQRTPAELDRIVDEWMAIPAANGPGLALLGSYGTGKSSYARAFVKRCASAYRAGTSRRVPLLIELKNFGVHQSIEGLITDELSNRHGVVHSSFETFQALNEAGNFVLVLDGFDEMKEGMSRDALVFNFGEIGRLSSGEAKVMLCGRPTIFEDYGEQQEVFRGGYADLGSKSAKYIQVELLPMPVERVLATITGFVATHRTELGSSIDQKVEELRNDLRDDRALRELLSRPVHVPMLLRILPRWRESLRDLRRVDLYRHFIDHAISREMKLGRLLSIGSAERRRFAGDLAVEMMSRGESGAVRQSFIPDRIIEPYRRGSEPLDATRRDLVKACFLERKPPDILYFPHKSFAEFLTAERLVAEAAQEKPTTDDFPVKLTPEVLSFLDEMLTDEHWQSLLGALGQNTFIAKVFFADLGTENASEADGIGDYASLRRAVAQQHAFDQLLRDGSFVRVREMVLYHIASGLERCYRDGLPVSERGREVLRGIAWHAADIPAVHAFRGLTLCDARASAEFMELQGKRWRSWKARGWLVAGQNPDIAEVRRHEHRAGHRPLVFMDVDDKQLYRWLYREPKSDSD